jgi:hypothetical protein
MTASVLHGIRQAPELTLSGLALTDVGRDPSNPDRTPIDPPRPRATDQIEDRAVRSTALKLPSRFPDGLPRLLLIGLRPTRQVIYTLDATEAVNRRVRKAIKSKGGSPTATRRPAPGRKLTVTPSTASE